MPARLVTYCFLILISGCTSPAIVATQSIQLGDGMNNENRYEEAIHHYKEFLRMSPQLGIYRNISQEADVNRKLAYAYSTQGKYRDSFSYLTKALAIDSTLAANALQVIDDYRELGVVKAYMGDYPEALRYLNRTLVLSEGMDKSAKDVKKVSLADTYLSLGQVHLTLGNFKEAGSFAGKALDSYKNIPLETAGTIECHLLLGIVNRDLGNLQEAVRWITTSEEISRKEGLNTARQHQALSEIYLLQGDPEKGIRHKALAIEQAEKSQIKPQIMMMYMRMGDAYQKLGDRGRAEYFYQKAMSVRMQMDTDTLGFIPSANMRFAEAERAYQYYSVSGATIGTALVSLRLGELRAQNNDFDSALMMFTSARELFEKAGSDEGAAKAHLELAGIYTAKQMYAPAIEHLERARNLTVQPELGWQIKLRKGIVQENSGSFDSAYQSYKDAIGIIDNMRGNISIDEFKTLFANTKVEVYDRLISLLLKNEISGSPPERSIREAFDYNEQSRSRTFLDMMGNKKIAPKDFADTSLLEKEQLLRLKIRQLTKQQGNSENGASENRLAEEIDKTYREFDHVISTIKLNNPAYSTMIQVKPPGVADIQTSLDHHTAVLEYWISDESLAIWVVSKDMVTAEIVPVGKNDLQRLLKGCRNAISFRDFETTREILKKLYGLLISPVNEKISRFKNLVVIPHRSLHFLPFQALISKTGSFLVEDFVITYSPASSIYYYGQQRKRGEGNEFLGMALGDLNLGDHTNLPGTIKEIEVLNQLYPRMVSRYSEECEETFIKDNIQNYDYVHIATHGVFNEHEPVYSYLLMAPSDKDDGRLTVDEIFGLNIRSQFVTLSACETALGELSEGDELVGLSRAFIYAGSAAVLVSLWKVEDSSTALLMTRFHQYIAAGASAAEALSQAQRDMIRRQWNPGAQKNFRAVDVSTLTSNLNVNNLDNPFFWAPFILVGNGDVK